MQGQAHAFTYRPNGLVNVLTTPVHVGRPIVDKSKSAIKPDDCGARNFVAIWDTGATNCVLTQRVIDECSLPAITRVKVNTVSGEEETTVHLASLFLPNHLVIPSVRMTKGKVAGGDILIGMDIIATGDFAVTNMNGKTVLSFRQPSIAEIDFVANAPNATASSVPNSNPASQFPIAGRNDPCPCGSGKKYKRCHGR